MHTATTMAPAATPALIPLGESSKTTQREALLLAVLEGLPYEVIAAHTGVSVGTVKSRISRARYTLERLLLEGEARPQSSVSAESGPSDQAPEADDAQAMEP